MIKYAKIIVPKWVFHNLFFIDFLLMNVIVQEYIILDYCTASCI